MRPLAWLPLLALLCSAARAGEPIGPMRLFLQMNPLSGDRL